MYEYFYHVGSVQIDYQMNCKLYFKSFVGFWIVHKGP